MKGNQLALFVSKKTHCTIKHDNKSFEIKYSNYFDKPKFSLNNNFFNIECYKNAKKIIIKKNKHNVMVEINKIPSDLGCNWGEYIVGCNQDTDIMLAILFGVAIGTLLIQSDNLLG